MEDSIKNNNTGCNGIIQSITTLVAIVVATIAVAVDRNYYINSINQTQQNFDKNYQRDSLTQATNIALTEMQISLLARQMAADSISQKRQLEISKTDLSVQLQTQKNMIRIDREKLRRVINTISATMPHNGYGEYRKWSNQYFHSFLTNIYKSLEQEEANNYILSNDSLSMVWNEMMRRIELSKSWYADTASMRFLGNPSKTISDHWSDQRYRDGSFVSDRTLVMRLLLQNLSVPEVLYGFRDPNE